MTEEQDNIIHFTETPFIDLTGRDAEKADEAAQKRIKRAEKDIEQVFIRRHLKGHEILMIACHIIDSLSSATGNDMWEVVARVRAMYSDEPEGEWVDGETVDTTEEE